MPVRGLSVAVSVATDRTRLRTVRGHGHQLACGLEVTAERSLTLPFDQFVFAELTNEGKGQRLQIHFATHEVSIHGQNLRRIETAMQRMELSFIAKVSTSYQSVVTQGQPVILKIAVTEVAPSKKQSEADG